MKKLGVFHCSEILYNLTLLFGDDFVIKKKGNIKGYLKNFATL